MKNSKQLYFELPNKTSLGLEDYIVADSNNFAFDLIVKMVKGEINFGLISGPPYSGKTHLSKILIKNASNYKSFYIDRDYQNILDRFEDSDILILENIDKVKHDKAEEDLFHIINLVKENNKKLLMTSRKSISEIDLSLEDLKSRLNSILEAKIKEPDDQLMELILIKIFNDKQLKINPNVIDFLMSRLVRSYKGINLFIEKIDMFSLEKGKKITIPLINDLLR
ncbi:MAG: DnaA ATPase domain-containing protein [Alphaproteobacteria bacterium]